MNNEKQNLILTPEIIQTVLELERIFMPQAKRQRDAAYARQMKPEEINVQPLKFVHYTSADAALNIIRNKRIWMRNTICMSDYREVQHGFDILNKFFSDKVKAEKFMNTVDTCVGDAAREAMSRFLQLSQHIRLNTFVTSVSEHDVTEDFHGRLSMWRAFASNTARVAIVFGVPRVSDGALALNLMFSPVAYLPEKEVYAVIEEVMDNVAKNKDFLASIDRQWVIGAIFNMFLAGVTCLKHEGFHEEREWRAIYCPKVLPSTLMKATIEVIGGFPQHVYQLPLHAAVSPALADLDFSRIFQRLIIGPSPYPWVMFEAFTEALMSAGITEARERVWASNIPIRTPF